MISIILFLVLATYENKNKKYGKYGKWRGLTDEEKEREEFRGDNYGFFGYPPYPTSNRTDLR